MIIMQTFGPGAPNKSEVLKGHSGRSISDDKDHMVQVSSDVIIQEKAITQQSKIEITKQR